MKYEQYVSLIQRLESYAQTNRSAYEYRVLGLAALGYGYFLGLILIALLIPGIFLVGLILAPSEVLRILWLAAKLWWILIPALAAFFGFIGGAIKALFTSVPPPEGRVLERSSSPELFDFVNETCRALKAQKPSKILLTDEFNAAVVTLPRFGLFGRKVYLMLGLPLMHSLSPDQFKAVVSHEIGHISEKHGSFAKWTYQLHEAWRRLIESQEAHDHKFSVLYDKFVSWFFPYFSAYSFVLMREHEKDADRHAVQLTGKQALGEALIALQTRGAVVDDVFWKEVHEENVKGAPVPTQLFGRMLASLAITDPSRDLTTLEKAVKVPTDYQDSHPALGERLRLMGYWSGDATPALPEKFDVSAADYFLGEAAKVHVQDFNRNWDEQIAQTWKARFEGYQKVDERIAELDVKSGTDALSVEEMIEKASLIAEKEGGLAALPMIRSIVETNPDHAEANYLLGGILVSNDDEEGMAYLDKSIALDYKWTLSAGNIAFQYLRSKGRLEDAKKYAAAIEQQQEKIEKADAERKWVHPTDEFEPHLLGGDVVETIIAKMKFDEEIRAMYLVRKTVFYFPEIPFHVLCLDVDKPRRFSRKASLSPGEIMTVAAERLGGLDISFFLTLDGNNAPIKKEVEKIPGAKIYERAS